MKQNQKTAVIEFFFFLKAFLMALYSLRVNGSKNLEIESGKFKTKIGD